MAEAQDEAAAREVQIALEEEASEETLRDIMQNQEQVRREDEAAEDSEDDYEPYWTCHHCSSANSLGCAECACGY